MALSRLNLLRPLLLRQLRCPLVVTSRLQQPPPLPACGLRLYATKKAKAKAKGQSAKLNINAALVEDIVDLGALRAEMAAVVSALKDDFTRSLSIRTSLVHVYRLLMNPIQLLNHSHQFQRMNLNCRFIGQIQLCSKG
ncbi:hypothetical protein fugu_018891 [Takifugu bimaculatus]|uniref:Uncharacterized protein n=1 Tax=Takifugu bimaculatus TaxID=433685 RepID=A0A4Z2BIS7_9TELE|nr:hypothetical protein fugu_018891 [Takifugu bimaculatus]